MLNNRRTMKQLLPRSARSQAPELLALLVGTTNGMEYGHHTLRGTELHQRLSDLQIAMTDATVDSDGVIHAWPYVSTSPRHIHLTFDYRTLWFGTSLPVPPHECDLVRFTDAEDVCCSVCCRRLPRWPWSLMFEPTQLQIRPQSKGRDPRTPPRNP